MTRNFRDGHKLYGKKIGDKRIGQLAGKENGNEPRGTIIKQHD